MGVGRFGGLRGAVAAEAARLMYEEGVKQYFTAKRLAAKRLLGRVGGRRLFAMRIIALEAMRDLAPFEPRLIGSVSTGHIRRGSDIDLHVFADDPDALILHARALGWVFETEAVSIFKFGEIREYLHLHVAAVFPLELTVYERRELRFRPRSSTDGKPIVRLKPAALAGLCAGDHSKEWERYQHDGTIAGLSEWLAHGDGADADAPDPDEPAAGPYDGLLTDLLCDDDPPDPAGRHRTTGP